MAAGNIDWRFKKKGALPSIGKAFRGRQYEQCAVAYCRRRGYRVLYRNLRLNGGELDVVAWDRRKNSLVVIEVRGGGKHTLSPSLTLSRAKRQRLERLAGILGSRMRSKVRVEFLEVRGALPSGGWKRWLAQWTLNFFPEWYGLSLKAYSVGPFTAPS